MSALDWFAVIYFFGAGIVTSGLLMAKMEEGEKVSSALYVYAILVGIIWPVVIAAGSWEVWKGRM